MTIRPFEMTNLVHLLEYLTTHSVGGALATEFTVKLTLDSDTNYDSDSDTLQAIRTVTPRVIGDVQAFSLRSRVAGVAGVAALFQETPYMIEAIRWKGEVGQSIRIDCLTREITLVTDSIAFAEICRHKVTGQRVRKFLVDLKIQ